MSLQQDLTSIDPSPHVTPARYLTEDIPGIGGRLKERPEDFIVDEHPLYEPKGEGDYIYLFIEKRGVTGLELSRYLAKHFRVGKRSIGYAGMKDKMAVTRQVISIHAPKKKIEDFPQFRHPGITVLWADYHDHALGRGQLAGNRFSIRVRGVQATDALTIKRAVDRLAETGVPNRYGEQRFGYLKNNHLIGRALILQRFDEARRLMLCESACAPEYQHEARAAAQRGDYEAASKAFPPSYRTERALCSALANGETVENALRSMERSVTGYYLSAFQSAVFNAVLDERVAAGTAWSFQAGDIAVKANGHGDRVVTADDDPAALASEGLSPSGPLWGTSMHRAQGDIDAIEVARLASLGLTPEDLGAAEELNADMVGGSRRPLMMPISNTEVEGGMDEHGPFVRCAFDLPRGGFATTVMAEIMKPDRHGEPAAEPDLSRVLEAETGPTT